MWGGYSGGVSLEAELLRTWLAATGAAASAATFLAYYLPGLNPGDGSMLLASLVFLSFPTAALVLPFAVLRLVLRTTWVIVPSGVLMLSAVYAGAIDLAVPAETPDSVAVFFLVFLHLVIVLVLAVPLDLLVRGAVRVRRSAASRRSGA